MVREAKKPLFNITQFTPTEFSMAQEKAAFANKLAAWVLAGFPAHGWTKKLYHDLSTYMFGHIAHYNMYGFHAEWFADVHKQRDWLRHAVQAGTFGDPSYTWVDVERAFIVWIKQTGLLEKYDKLCAG